MVPHLFYYQLLVLGLLWLFIMLSLTWPNPSGPQAPRPATPRTTRRKHGKESQPFGGLTRKPLWTRVRIQTETYGLAITLDSARC
jgi:hypothetical protein